MQVLYGQYSKRSQGGHQQQNRKVQQKMQKLHNKLQKYKVVKMMSTGDYICNDHLGNSYLLVCQASQGGYNQYKAAIKNNFVRNSKNRALITPFEDIEHDGLKFTVYMLPERSISFSEAISSKSSSQIYCLSLIYTIVNKVVKPLLQIFNHNTDKWLHVQNIWLKQSTMYYILSQRKKSRNVYSIKKTEHKNQKDQPEDKSKKQALQKIILRRLCVILAPHFKIDYQHKTFLPIIIQAMLNQQLSIQQLCFLLNDRKKRKSFMEEKTQDSQQVIQNQALYYLAHKNNDLWKKRKLYIPDSNNRRQLRNQTLNIQAWERRRNTINYQTQIKMVGQTINLPPSFQSRKASFNSNRMFDLKNIGKKRNSLSHSKRYSKKFTQTISVSQNIQKMYQTGMKNSFLDKNTAAYAKVQQRAYRKFCENSSSPRQQKIILEQEDKKLRALLISRSEQKSRRSATIQIGELKNNRFRIHEHSAQTTNPSLINAHSIKRNQEQQAKQIEFKSNLQKLRLQMKQNQQKQKRQQQLNREKEIMKANLQKQKLAQIQRQKKLDKQKQQKFRLLQIQKQKERQREIQRQKLLQKQKQKQMERLKQIERRKQVEKQKQIQKQIQRQKQLQKQRERQKQKQRQLQLQIQKQKAEKQQQKLAKNKSMNQITNKNFNNAQSLNLDEIQIIEPKLKQQLEAKKRQKQLEEQRLLQKSNRPPLPNQSKDNNLRKTNAEKQTQIQQIVLNKNTSKTNKPQQTKKPSPSVAKKLDTQQISEEQKKTPIKKQEADSQQRTKTVTSEIASSCGPKKPVSKQVAQYMHMINKMGEGVAKSSRISAKLEGVDWFTGIYFIYKRFLFQRKKIQKWLASKQPNLTRYQEKNLAQWDEWYKSQQKRLLQQKVKLENENIVNSILKMNKKLMKKQLPANFIHHASLSKHSPQQSKIAVSEVVKQYDLLDEKQKLQDDEILTHINQLMSALYIIAELDGKVKQKKPLIQIIKKKNQDELAEFSDLIYDMYIKQ